MNVFMIHWTLPIIVPKLSEILHVTRRCGKFTLNAIDHLLTTFDSKKVPILDILEESTATNIR